MERQWRDVPDLWVTDDPEFRDAVYRSTRENVELILAAIGRPSAIPRALPPGPRLEADVTAQNGARSGALLRTYRVGQQALIEYMLDAVDAGGIARPTAALRTATRTIHVYTESIIPLVATEHAAERERLVAHPDLRRLRTVQAALGGDRSVELGYELEAEHVAVVASDPDVRAAIAEAARALDAPLLAVRGPDDREWAWLATAAVDDLRERLATAELSGSTGVAGPIGGFAGFRMSHRQASIAQRVGRARGQAVVDVRSAVLEALALGDQRMAWQMARAELGPLAAAPAGQDRLRRTLEAWFASRESLSATARTLDVAPRTVSYRLRRAEELLGQRIGDRRAELEVALRLLRVFERQPPAGA